MLLATDLDGTFLAGSEEDRQQLYHLISNHPSIQLVFVTGRGLERVMPLLSDPSIPRPDYIISDVGGTIVDGETLQPLNEIQGEIEMNWPGELAVTQVMEDFPAITRQEVPQERRSSYYCRQDQICEELTT
ncbi:MAG: HAD family hydrolase, partial [Oceanobacter sp.]